MAEWSATSRMIAAFDGRRCASCPRRDRWRDQNKPGRSRKQLRKRHAPRHWTASFLRARAPTAPPREPVPRAGQIREQGCCCSHHAPQSGRQRNYHTEDFRYNSPPHPRKFSASTCQATKASARMAHSFFRHGVASPQPVALNRKSVAAAQPVGLSADWCGPLQMLSGCAARDPVPASTCPSRDPHLVYQPFDIVPALLHRLQARMFVTDGNGHVLPAAIWICSAANRGWIRRSSNWLAAMGRPFW